MGKKEPSDEDIRNWIKEGWKFTKRKRKGHVYITRRKGANLERSHGRFKQSLWKRIEKIKRELEEPKREYEPLSTFYALVEVNRAALSSRDCLHRDGEGYCTFWRWTNDYSLLGFRGDLDMKGVTVEGKPAYLFLAHAKYCSGCAAYVSVKMRGRAKF